MVCPAWDIYDRWASWGWGEKKGVWAVLVAQPHQYGHLPTHAMIRGCSCVLLRSYRAAERVGAMPVASTVAMELRRRQESSE